MKKYIAPNLSIIEMESTDVFATSKFNLYSDDNDGTTQIQLTGRNRGTDWEDYESR